MAHAPLGCGTAQTAWQARVAKVSTDNAQEQPTHGSCPPGHGLAPGTGVWVPGGDHIGHLDPVATVWLQEPWWGHRSSEVPRTVGGSRGPVLLELTPCGW